VKQRVALILLIIGGLFFIEGWMVLCYCPGGFLIAAAVCVFPMCVGNQLLRTIAILVCGASLVAASHMYLKDVELKGKVQRIRLLQQKKARAKPLATFRAERIVQAA
jgi:hypothetical protein